MKKQKTNKNKFNMSFLSYMGPYSNSVLYFSFSNLRKGVGFDYMTKMYSEFTVSLSLKHVALVGCFGFNGPLRQYFSLYRAVSQRRRGKRKMIQPPTRTHYKHSRSLPNYSISNTAPQ